MNIEEIKKMANNSLIIKWEDTIKKLECSQNLKIIIRAMYIWGYIDGSKDVCEELNEEVSYE